MDARPTYAVADSYADAWRLKWRLLAAHLAFSVLFVALLAPVLAISLRVALLASGQPALTDQDIAMFLLSPLGALGMLGVAALFVAVQIVSLSLKMSILHAGRASTVDPFIALARVSAQAGRLVAFALRLVLRILVIVLPFLAVSAAIAFTFLTEYDINFYLTERPPEFLLAGGAIGLVLLAMAALLIPRLLSWALALPLVLFTPISPADSFAESAARMAGRRVGLLVRMGLWALIAFVLVIFVALVAGGAGAAAGAFGGEDLPRLAGALLVALALVGTLNLAVGTLNSGAFADIILDEADWPAVPPPERAGWLPFGAVVVAGLVALVFGAIAVPGIQPVGDVSVIAHRGGAVARPENTMAAMEQGIADGADWLEIDVQESADGEVIVIHDSDFMKIAGNPLKVWEATAEDLAAIDIGSRFDAGYSDARTPRLTDVLRLAKDRTNVLIELKYYGHDDRLEERVAEIVEAENMIDQVAFMSLKPEQVATMQQIRPDWTTGLLAATAVGRLWEVEADFLAVNAAIATPRLIRNAHEAGKQVHVWTLNDAAGMARMAGLGVDGLITDRPALARRVLDDLAELSLAERAVLGLADRLGIDPPGQEMRDASP